MYRSSQPSSCMNVISLVPFPDVVASLALAFLADSPSPALIAASDAFVESAERK